MGLTLCDGFQLVCIYVCMHVCAWGDSGLSYHYRGLVLRVHLDWDRQFAARIEFRLYALFYRISKFVGLQSPRSPSHHVVVHK